MPVLKAIQAKVPPPKAPQAAAPPAATEASSAAAEPDVAASDEETDVDLREWELVAPPSDPHPMLTPTDDYESIPATRIQLLELPSEQAAMHGHTLTYVVSTDLTQEDLAETPTAAPAARRRLC